MMMRESVGGCFLPFQGATPVPGELPLQCESIHAHDDEIAFGSVFVQAHRYADEDATLGKLGSAQSGSPKKGFHGPPQIPDGGGVS